MNVKNILFMKHVYLSNIMVIECKRVIPIAKLAGLTKSTYKESKEFVIHVRNDYDYRMSSELYVIFNIFH